MENNKVIELLKNYRSYEYAVNNCGLTDDIKLPLVLNERRRNPVLWDQTRYNRIVNLINGAVNQILSDDQRTVIMRKYLDRNALNLGEISDLIHKDRTTVSRLHKEAIRRLAIALDPISFSEREIDNFDHMFDPKWEYQEPA